MENYELIAKIGSGACGAVYLVRSHVNGRQYALKKVQIDEQKRTRTREALLREAGILAKLKHPHIVVYHDSFFDVHADDLHYIHIVQDYCDAGTLDDKIIEMRKKQQFFEESTIMEWFIQIAMAVQYIHSNKILHRDLKAQNVFMTKSEGVKLGDFGIAKVLDSTLDAAVTCVGTPCYLSPELCQDIPYSSKADIWALGCLLFELCALKPAFDASNLISLFYKITKAEYAQLPQHYTTELSDLIAAVLVKEPEKRPSASNILNMSTVRNYLEIFIKDREYLLQQKIISLKAKTGASGGVSSPVCSRSRKLAGCQIDTPRRSMPAMRLKDLNEFTDLAKSFPLQSSAVSKKSVMDSPEELAEAGGQNLPSYSDDFDSTTDSSCSEPVSEDIPEEIERDAVDNDDISPTNPPGADALCHYDDDFEEDSEAEELDDIINKAKQACTLQAEDEFFADESQPTNKQSLRQYLEKLGDVPVDNICCL